MPSDADTDAAAQASGTKSPEPVASDGEVSETHSPRHVESNAEASATQSSGPVQNNDEVQNSSVDGDDGGRESAFAENRNSAAGSPRGAMSDDDVSIDSAVSEIALSSASDSKADESKQELTVGSESAHAHGWAESKTSKSLLESKTAKSLVESKTAKSLVESKTAKSLVESKTAKSLLDSNDSDEGSNSVSPASLARTDTSQSGVVINEDVFEHRRNKLAKVASEARLGWGEDLVADYKILFDEIDVDHSGYIDVNELRQVFGMLELKFSKRKVQRMIDSVDCTGSGEVDFEGFLTLLFKLHDPKARSWNLTVVFDYTEFAKPCLQQTRSDIWKSLDDPSSSAGAQAVTIAIICVIVLSTVLIVLQSIPEFYDDTNGVIFGLEFFCGVVFSLEFLMRATTTPHCGSFVSSFMNWIDFLSIVPFWGEIVILAVNSALDESQAQVDADDVEFLVVMRAVRVFRILKVSRYVRWVNIFTQALSHSASALLTVVYIIFVMVLVLAAVMFYLENDRWDPVCGGHNVGVDSNGCYVTADGQRSGFYSIPVCIWWCIITISTIGFGDMIPQTGIGKLLASFTAVAGVIILAVPISIVSANFRDVFRRFQQRVWLEKRRKQIKEEVAETSQKSPSESFSVQKRTSLNEKALNVAEEVWFSTYQEKYLSTLQAMTAKNNRRFGYGLELQGAASRTILVDRLCARCHKWEASNHVNHDEVIRRLRVRDEGEV